MVYKGMNSVINSKHNNKKGLFSGLQEGKCTCEIVLSLLF